MTASIEDRYPHLTQWVTTHGWIELGQTDYSQSVIRIFDEGGMVWEGDLTYPTIEDALQAAEEAVIAWMR